MKANQTRGQTHSRVFVQRLAAVPGKTMTEEAGSDSAHPSKSVFITEIFRHRQNWREI